MRKVLSFVLVLSLVLGSFGMAFAAPLSDVAGEDFEDAVNVLTELGVVNGYPDGTFRPDNIVTRAEMAVIVVSALGLADYANGTSSFSDMGGHWSNGFVAYATSLGAISGYPDGTFRPDNTVTYDEAATMLVAALGYTPDSLIGTWPANYVTKAKTLGILDGIKGGAVGANRGDIATMAFQTLDQNIGKTDKDGVWDATVLKDDGTTKTFDNMLGRVGAELYKPAGAATKAGDPFVLTDTLADDAVSNVRDMIGAYVTAYANSDGDILAIKEVKSVFLTGEFDAGGAFGVALVGDVFEADKDYDIIGVTAPAVLFPTVGFTNGEVDAALLAVNTTDTYKIAADVSGKKIKDIYSVSVWAEDAAFLFEDDMLEDDNLNGHKFKLDDNDEIMLDSFELVGVDSLSDIDEDNVIYVYLDAASEITRIDVGTETVSGEITKINSAGDTFTIDGKAYSLAEDPAATAYYGGTLTAGDEVKLILDAAGDIYDVDSISSANTYAMVVAVDDGVVGAFGSDPEILLVLADGTNKVFKADAKAIDDGTGAIIDETTLAWNDGVAGDPVNEGALIKYNVNADGEINAITALTELDGTTASKLKKTGHYKGAKVKSDAVILVYDGTAAFGFGGPTSYFVPLAPATAIDEDDFDVTTLDKILDTDIAAYYTKNSSGLIDFMVIDSAAIVSDEVYGIVTGSGTNNSDAGFYVTLLIDGVESTVDAAADYSALRANTTNGHIVVEVSYDTKGVVSLQNAETATLAASATATTVGASFKLTVNSSNVVSGIAPADATLVNFGAPKFNAATGFTLAEDVAIYKLDGSKYVKATMSDLKASLTEAKFFDSGATADQDEIVDVVLITKL